MIVVPVPIYAGSLPLAAVIAVGVICAAVILWLLVYTARENREKPK